MPIFLDSGSRPNISTKLIIVSTNGIKTNNDASIPEIFSELIFFPNNPLMRNPIKGKRGIK